MPQQRFTRAGVGAGPDPTALAAAITAAAPTVTGIWPSRDAAGVQSVDVDKPTAWQAGEITAVQTAINGVPNNTAALTQQALVDKLAPLEKAILLTLLDQINVLRADITTLGISRPPISVATAIAAVRTKIGTL